MAVVIILVLLALAALLFLRRTPGAARSSLPKGSIVVDGSNVMHWGGEPSAKILVRVLQSLISRGFSPVVFFDANVGYKLRGRFMSGDDMAMLCDLPAAQIHVVDSGTAADEALLTYATVYGLRVVSNDGFRDWTVAFPIVRQKARIMRGTWRDGAVRWR